MPTLVIKSRCCSAMVRAYIRLRVWSHSPWRCSWRFHDASWLY